MNEDTRVANIKLLAMDVDGTLTDGSMVMHGAEQIKAFHAHDGLGIRLAMNVGLRIAWVTGNASESVAVRARSLGVEDVYQGSWCKSDAINDLAARYGLSTDEIAFIGDDLNDVPAFETAGFRFAPANATEEVKARADMVTTREGGRGAVREAIEAIFRAQGRWEEAVESFIEMLKREKRVRPVPEALA